MALILAVGGVFLSITKLLAAVPAFEARGVQIPLFDLNRTATIATLKVARAGLDHHRFGAFSVKLLPMLVAEGVVLEIEQPQAAREALARLGPQLRALGHGDSFEARGFALRFPGEFQPRLTAGRLRPVGSKGTLLLSLKGGALHAGGERIEVPSSARLDCAAGQVTWAAAGHVIHFDLIHSFFSTNQINPPGITATL